MVRVENNQLDIKIDEYGNNKTTKNFAHASERIGRDISAIRTRNTRSANYSFVGSC